MASESRIDPRYAAQFQRGYDPAQHASPPPRQAPVRLEGGPPPTAPRVPDPPRMAAPGAEEPDAEAPTVADTEQQAVGRTRWDWLLPGVGAGLVLIALLLWASYFTDLERYSRYGYGVNGEWAAFLDQARYALPGPLLTAGMIAVTAGIVLQALRHRR
jgi:hypothetical protein